MLATAYLKDPGKHDTGPVVAIFGKERFLKTAALQAVKKKVLGSGEEDEQVATRFEGHAELELKTVVDELRTVSMWGDRRLVIVEDAETFVTNHRAGLEKYVAKPAKKGVLVLEVKSWPGNTRLAKAVAEAGLALDCAELKGQAVVRWAVERARDGHEVRLAKDAASLLVEFVGNELGRLDQELAKLAAYVGERQQVATDDVRILVGGWKAETTFAMFDALQEDDPAAALEHLARLHQARQAPELTLGGIAFKLRPLARVVALTARGESLGAAIRSAGVQSWDLERARQYLRRIGRPRAEKLLERLLQADGRLKGESRAQSRMVVERLLVELSGRV